MNKGRSLSALLGIFILTIVVILQVSAQQTFNPAGKGSSHEALDPATLGDELSRIDLESKTGHDLLVGVEYVDGHYFVSSGGENSPNTDANYLFQLTEDGTVVNSWLQGTTSSWGWRDLAWDGTYLYASDSNVIDQIDPTTGQATGVTIPAPVSLARGLAYDPISDHFWATNYFEDIYEIDRDGTVVNNFSTSLEIYGLAWDAWSPGGPFLWTWSKDGSPAVYATQIDPDTGLPTGIGFQGSSVDGLDEAGGADIAPDLVENKVVLIAIHQSNPKTLINYDLGQPSSEPPTWGKLDLCIPADEAPFVYLNQPWDWLEGAVDPDQTVNATLRRNGSQIANAGTTADENGRFSLDFQDGGHLDILPNDQIELSGRISTTLTVVDIQGWIDVPGDGVGGQATGGPFDVWGVVCVRQPSDLNFASLETYFDANGRFDAQFDGLVDIDYDFIAQVVYPDPNGNYVVQLFYPEGLDLRVLMTDDLVEGVTTPGESVTVIVWDGNGTKGIAETIADETGFYSTAVYDNGQKVDLALGDHVGVSNSGYSREIFLTMSHKSYLQPWNNRVLGTVQGFLLPAGGTQGRVDLWNASDKQWYTLFTWIEPDGQYGADFSGIVEMTPADRIRLWVRDEDGTQQASIGATLDYGVSTSHDKVWGYTAAESIVELNLYKGHDGDGNLLDLIGSAAVRADPSGYYTATLTADGFPVDIAPTNVLQVIAAEHIKTLFIGQLTAEGDMDNDSLTIYGPPDAVVQLVGYRSIAAAAQTLIPSSYLQLETTIGSNGEVTIDLAQYDLQDGDIFDVTAYIVEQGAVIHRTMMAPSFEDVFLPLVMK